MCLIIEQYFIILFEEYEGVGDMLDSLHERGYKTAVCSNADEEYIEEVLDKLDLREKIDRVRPIIPGKGKVESLAPFFTG